MSQEKEAIAAELEDTQRSKVNLEAEIVDLQTNIETLQSEHQQVTSQTQSSETLIQSLQQQIQDNRDRHQSELEEAGNIIQQLEEQLNAAVQPSPDTPTGEPQAGDQISKLIVSNQALEKKVKTLGKDNQKLQDAMKMAQEVVGSLQTQVKTLTQTKADLERQLKASLISKASETIEVQVEPEVPVAQDVTPEAEEAASGGKFANQIFVITGKFKQVSAEKVRSLIEAEGGSINTHPSKKTNYVIVGENPGNKLKKAQKYNTPQLSESELLELLDA